MKLRIYFRPFPVVLLLLAVAALLWLATYELPGGSWLSPVALFYSALTAISVWALGRLLVLERWRTWSEPHRLLILAPHEDDCVISAGGVALHNQRLGGVVRIVYLAPDETPGLPDIRAAEARAAAIVEAHKRQEAMQQHTARTATATAAAWAATRARLGDGSVPAWRP